MEEQGEGVDSMFSESCLVFVDVIRQLGFAQFVECDNDKSDKNVDKEKGKDDEVDDVIYGHLCPEPGDWSLVLER